MTHLQAVQSHRCKVPRELAHERHIVPGDFMATARHKNDTEGKAEKDTVQNAA